MGTPHRSNTTANGICRPTNGQVKSTRCACPSYKETSPATEMFTPVEKTEAKRSSVWGPASPAAGRTIKSGHGDKRVAHILANPGADLQG